MPVPAEFRAEGPRDSDHELMIARDVAARMAGVQGSDSDLAEVSSLCRQLSEHVREVEDFLSRCSSSLPLGTWGHAEERSEPDGA